VLAQQLTLQVSQAEVEAGAGAGAGAEIMTEEEIEYRAAFNADVVALFGSPPLPAHKTDAAAPPKKRKTSPVSKRAGATATATAEPLLLPLITCYTQWGKGLGHFLKVAGIVVSQLCADALPPERSAASPPPAPLRAAAAAAIEGVDISRAKFTKSAWETTLYSQDPATLTERLAVLPLHELHVYAAAARLQARTGLSQINATNRNAGVGVGVGLGAGAGESADTSSSSGPINSHKPSSSHRPKVISITVADICNELDKLTAVLRRQESTYARVLGGLETLAREGLLVLHTAGKVTPLRLVSDHTQVLLLSPDHDIRHAFQWQGQGQEQGRRVDYVHSGNKAEGEGLGAATTPSTDTGAGAGAGAAVSNGDIGFFRAYPALVISDRVRRAVLEPAEVPPALPDSFR